MTTISPELVEDLLADVARRRHLLRDRPDLQVPVSLHLRASGPGYCLHEPLAADPRTAPLLERIRAIGAEPGADELVGDDLVHYDLHPGNVLVAGDPPRLSAIVDWGAATSGDVALDLAVLSADLAAGWDQPALAARVERVLEATTPQPARSRLWAHVALRFVDWSLRHSPERVEAYVAVVERRLHHRGVTQG